MGHRVKEIELPECFCCRFNDSPLPELECNKSRSIAIPIKRMINITKEDQVHIQNFPTKLYKFNAFKSYNYLA